MLLSLLLEWNTAVYKGPALQSAWRGTRATAGTASFPKATHSGSEGLCTGGTGLTAVAWRFHDASSWEHVGLQREMLITGSANAFFFFKKKILCPILNQYVLIKEVGLNIEKYWRKKSQGIQYNTKSLVTF